MQEQGGDGDVVIGDSTARLVEALVTLAPLGSFSLKGRAKAVAAFKVESLERPEIDEDTAKDVRDRISKRGNLLLVNNEAGTFIIPIRSVIYIEIEEQ